MRGEKSGRRSEEKDGEGQKEKGVGRKGSGEE